MDTNRWQINRVDLADLEAASLRLPRGAGIFMREIGALAESYFGAIDQGDVEALLAHLDPNGFKISFPARTLTSENDYREWYSGVESTFSHLKHTVVALDPKMVTKDSARVMLSVHGENDFRNPEQHDEPRENMTFSIIWDLSRTADGRWVISSQRGNPEPTPGFSKERTRQFAVSYLDNLDRRNLDGMLDVLAPQSELNIALNQGLIIEDFPQWFRMIDETFINSKHRVQGLVALENADGTIDAHLRIYFTADWRNPPPDTDGAIELTVNRI